MIGESLHFYFGNRKSTDFGIVNVNYSEGLFEETAMGHQTINEVSISGRDEPYLIGVDEEPKTLELRFGFLEPWNDRLIEEVIRWLSVKTYQPLYFEGNIDRVYYAMPVDSIKKIHNGLKSGYLVLQMRCNSSKSYSHEIRTETFNTSRLAEKQNVKRPTITIGNRGFFSTYPKIWLEKIGTGEIIINNITNNNQEFKFKNIAVGEQLIIDCRKEIIQTSLENTYRYDDFNDNYLELVYGENILSLSDNLRIQFGIKYIFS